MVWLVLFLGFVVLGACFLLPREIGKEDEPLANVRLQVPNVEQLVLRMQLRNRPRPAPVAARPVAPSLPAQPPPAMGATQPVLTDSGQ